MAFFLSIQEEYMKGNKELYKKEVNKLLENYKMSSEIASFLDNMVHISFGLEQIKRGISPFNFKFYSKNQRYLEKFISKLKNISEENDDVFRVSKHKDYYFISCVRKSFECKHIIIYRGHFKDYEDFFEKVNLNFDFNYLAYDYIDNKIYAKNDDLLEYRLENYNKDDEDELMNFVSELACEDLGGEWAECHRKGLSPLKKKCFRKTKDGKYWEMYYA